MFVVVQNDPKCPPGTCTRILAASGHPFRTVAGYGCEPFPDPEALTGVIVLGGGMGVHDTDDFPCLERARAFILRTLQAGTPLLGICLGGQLLAHVAGGSVTARSPYRERGICSVDLNDSGAADPVFSGIPRSFTTFQFHNDSFTPPPGATLLATSAACPAQAFRLPGCVYGVQFHPEMDRSIVSTWGALFTPPKDFLTPFLAAEAQYNEASATFLKNFADLAAASCRP